MPLIRLVAAMTLAFTGAADAAYFIARSTVSSTPPAADIVISPSGVDAAGTTIGVACTYASPCLTQQKAADMLAANIATTPNRNYVVVLRGGRYPTPASTLVLNAGHTPGVLSATVQPADYSVTWKAYPGETPVWSGGVDISGTFSATTLPGGGAGCYSDALAANAPLINDPSRGRFAPYYVGFATVNGSYAPPVFYPRRGHGWLTLTSASKSTAPVTAGFTSGSASIAISDMSYVGLVGDPIAFGNPGGNSFAGFAMNHVYWIKTRSINTTGSGTVTVGYAYNSGSAQTATATATYYLQSGAVSPNQGDRQGSFTSSTRPFSVVVPSGTISATPAYTAGYNRDLKLAFGHGGSMVQVDSYSGTTVQLSSAPFKPYNLGVTDPDTQIFRTVGDYGHLGDSGYTGEVYHDRTTGRLFYSLRSGESCAGTGAGGLAKAGAFIVPRVDQLVRVSNAVADASGATTGMLVGKVNFVGITFSDVQTPAFSCDTNDINGNVCGAQQGAFAQNGSHKPAIAFVGATRSSVTSGRLQSLGQAGVGSGYGSNNITVASNIFRDIGSHAWNAGHSLNGWTTYQYVSVNSDYTGSADMGPSTVQGGQDVSGNNANNSFIGNYVDRAAIYSPNGGSVATAGAQNITISQNTILHCPGFCLSNQSTPFVTVAEVPGEYGAGASIYRVASFGLTWSYNNVGFAGYEPDYSGSGLDVPNSTRVCDYGLAYTRGAQDGAGGAGQRMLIERNWFHDASGAQNCLANVVYYLDGNDSNGITSRYNLISNAATVGGVTQYTNTATQFTGGLRTEHVNNIYSIQFAEGLTYPNGAAFKNDVGTFEFDWRASEAKSCSGSVLCYLIFNQHLYSSTTSGTTGASLPTCATGSGATCADGSMTWTWVKDLTPEQPYNWSHSNIMLWGSNGTSLATAFPPFRNPVTRNLTPLANKRMQYDSNMWDQDGATFPNMMTNGASVSISGWQSTYLQDTASSFNVDPNFVNWRAGTLAGFKFNATGGGTSCGDGTTSPACGLGFVPWDLTQAGSILTP